MKNSDILNAVCSIDEGYLDKSFDFQGLSSDFKKEKNKRLRSVCAVCCCIAVGFTALGVSENGRVLNNPQIVNEEGESKVNNSLGTEQYLEKPWDERCVTGKFPGVVFNNIEYCALSNEVSKSVTHKVEKRIGDKAISVIDYATEKKHSTKAAIYSLSNISSDCIIAVKFKGYDGLYAYMNTDYGISNLGDLISALDLRNTLILGNVEDKSINDGKNRKIYSVKNQNDIWKHLLSKPDAEDFGDKDIAPLFAINANVPSLGIENKVITVSEDGYIQTNILEVAHTFYIGRDSVNDFKEYVATLQSSTVSIDNSGAETLE